MELSYYLLVTEKLKPITLNKPKVLVKIKISQCLSGSIFNNLNSPPKEILINTHYLSNQIVSFLKKKI